MSDDFPQIHLVLASASPRRRDLLHQWGASFEVVPSRADELDAEHDTIRDTVIENARRKGGEVFRRIRSQGKKGWVLAADTLVIREEKVYGKPQSLEQARQFMDELGGVYHSVLTGVYLIDLKTGQSHDFVEETRVRLVVMTCDEMDRLFERVDPLDKAGGYGYQDAPEIVDDLIGSRTNVIGLPMTRLLKQLNAIQSSE